MKIPFITSLIGELAFHINEDNLRIRADQIKARLRLYPVMLGIQSLLEPLFVWLNWGHTDQQQLLIWLTCMYTIHISDLVLWLFYRKQINTVQECRRWSLVFKIFTAFTATMWGFIAVWFFPPDLAYQALMICITLGLVAGAVSLDSVYPPSLYIYVLGVVIPMMTRLLLANDETHWILASMLLLFLFGAMSAGRELSKTFWRSLWQRYENDMLIQQLTEQKAIAETANRDKSRFLASASHDLRQPLQALVLFSDAMQDVTNKIESQHLAKQIGKSVGALVDMFDELLDISKFDAGVVQADKKHFKLQSVFDRLLADFTHLAASKSLKFSVPMTSLVGYSDPHLMERIMRNLISNAIRYTDVGQVKVTCNCIDGCTLHIEVMDTGIGIRADSMPHIFEEYYQVDNQHRDRLKGLGLGLAIVRRMEKLLNCRVIVDSVPGQGSNFSFSIPQGDAAQLEKSRPTQQSRYDLSGVSVALVDDNLDIRQMVAGFLKQWGCHVIDGELPQVVFDKLTVENIRPDILICDYRLPHKLTAIDAIDQLRKQWKMDIPALVLTGDTAPETLQEIKTSGALLLHKPIAPARLRSILYFALHAENSANLAKSADKILNYNENVPH